MAAQSHALENKVACQFHVASSFKLRRRLGASDALTVDETSGEFILPRRLEIFLGNLKSQITKRSQNANEFL